MLQKETELFVLRIKNLLIRPDEHLTLNYVYVLCVKQPRKNMFILSGLCR
jgi:hypothetical protein